MRSNMKARTYSVYSRKAVALMGKLIQLHRKERKMTLIDLADRIGISRTTLHKIENGDMKCEIGIVFEAAALVGVKLFATDPIPINFLQERIEDKIALLPKSVRQSKESIDDNF